MSTRDKVGGAFRPQPLPTHFSHQITASSSISLYLYLYLFPFLLLILHLSLHLTLCPFSLFQLVSVLIFPPACT